MTQRRPCIGVFDSGVGGLTVLRSLIERIPDADYIYFGDTARLPYGSKSAQTVAHYAVGAAHYLESHGAQMLVIACNTATALALEDIRKGAHVPVAGVIEPGARAAAKATQNRKIVVVGTVATVQSHAYCHALERLGMRTREKACPLFVPLVEEGWIEHPVTQQVAEIYMKEAFNDSFADADVLLLGCTHYPLLKPLLRKIAPSHVVIVDSADSTATVVAGHLRIQPLAASENSKNAERRAEPRLKFLATDSVEKFRMLGQRFLARPIEDVTHVDLKE